MPRWMGIMADLEQSAEQLFGEALDLPAEQRSAFLDQACRGAPELRRLDQGYGYLRAGYCAAPGARRPAADRIGERPLGHSFSLVAYRACPCRAGSGHRRFSLRGPGTEVPRV